MYIVGDRYLMGAENVEFLFDMRSSKIFEFKNGNKHH